ncbi:MAG: hypothetical protein A2Z34_08300 [Planctomycetes bacterium RBG_16_59_8]|nr:MAG: hypothetical protein A2Z34_08300 [Planctomycetes bacterium RBG_16_59_8]
MQELRDDTTIEWTVHPFRKNIRKSAALLFLLAGLSLFFHIAMASPGNNPTLFTIAVSVILFLSLRDYFFPTHYRLSAEGVLVETTFGRRFKRWNSFRSFSLDANGLFLSPFEGRSRLENFRGLYLLLDGNGPQVASYVKERVLARAMPLEGVAR